MSGGFRQSRYRADLQEMACPSACNWPPVPGAGSYCCKPRRSTNKQQNGTRRCRDWRRPRRDGQIRPSSRATFGLLQRSPQLTLLEVANETGGTTASALLTLVVGGAAKCLHSFGGVYKSTFGIAYLFRMNRVESQRVTAQTCGHEFYRYVIHFTNQCLAFRCNQNSH